MQNYTLSLLFPATLSDEQLKEILERIKQQIANLGGIVSNIKESERKRLAYVIKKIRNGIYVDIVFNLAKDKTKDLEKDLKLMPEIIRYIFLKVKETKKQIKIKKQKIEKLEINEQDKKPKKQIKIEDLDKKIDEILENQVV